MEMAPSDISSPKDHSLATYLSLSFAPEIHLLSLSHMVCGLLEPYRLGPLPFLLYLLSNYHQTWCNSTMAQNLSRAVKVKSIITSL